MYGNLRSVAGLLGPSMGLCVLVSLSGWPMFCFPAGQRIIEKLGMRDAYHEKHGKHGKAEKLCMHVISQSEKLEKSLFSLESASTPGPTVEPLRVFHGFLAFCHRCCTYIHIHTLSIREFFGVLGSLPGGASNAPPRRHARWVALWPRWVYPARHGNPRFLDTG
jgi:hypothetical protein